MIMGLACEPSRQRTLHTYGFFAQLELRVFARDHPSGQKLERTISDPLQFLVVVCVVDRLMGESLALPLDG